MKNESTRVLVADLDGTLLHDDATLSQFTLDAIQSWLRYGNYFVIATGRAPRLVRQVLPEALYSLPWVCYNGAEIYDKRKKIYQNYMTGTTTQKVADFLQYQYPDSHIRLEIDDHVLTERVIPEWSPETYTVVKLLSSVTSSCAKIIFWLDNLDRAKFLADHLPSVVSIIKLPSYNAIEVLSRTASKGTALAFLLRQWGLDFKQVIAVGDNVNDWDMIQVSGLGIAVGNATEQTQSMADAIIATNQQDGVAQLINQLLS